MTLHPGLHPWKNFRPWTRHSLVLFVAGAVYVAVGITFILADATPARKVALHYALELWSLDSWGAVFILAGALAILSSRWPPISKTWGYTVLTGLSAAWSAFYFFAIWFADAPTTNYSSVLSWALTAFMWWAISGLVDADKTNRR